MKDNKFITTTANGDSERIRFPDIFPATSETGNDHLTIADLWRVLQKRRWLVLGSLGFVVLLVTAISILLPRRYDAYAKLLLDLEGSENLALDQVVMPVGIDLDTKLQTQMRIVQSDTIATGVIEELGLQNEPEFVGKQTRTGRSFANLDVRTRAALVDRFHRAVRVELIPKTEIIEIHFRSGDPSFAANVANAVARTYLENNFQTKYQAMRQTSDWLTKQLDDVKKNGEIAEQQLISYQKKTGLLGTDETHNIVVDRLELLNKALSEAEGDRIMKEAKYRIAMTENPDLIANVVPESLLGTLYKQRADSRSEYAQLAAKYGVSYPRVIQLQSQLSELDSSIAQETVKVSESLRAEYRAALRSQEMLQATFEKQKDSAFKMNEDAIQYGIMRREVESSRDLYEGLLKKLKEAGILAGLRSSNINIIDVATVPVVPVEPRIPLNIALGCDGGLLFGISAAFIVESVDSSIRTPEDVENYCRLPPLGIIPSVSSANSSGRRMLVPGPTSQIILPVTVEHRNSGSAEAFRALRTSLMLSSPGAPPQVVVVTSAVMQEGKSFVSINLAVVLAQTGQQVLLVDADSERSFPPIRFGEATVVFGCRRSAASALAARTVSDSLISTTGLTLTLRGAEIPEPDSRPCLHSIPHSTSVATIPNAFGGRNTGKGRSRRQFRGSVSDSVELLFRRATEARSGVTKNAISHVSLVQGQGELSGENLDTMSTLALSSPAPSSPWANRLNGGSYRASRDPA